MAVAHLTGVPAFAGHRRLHPAPVAPRIVTAVLRGTEIPVACQPWCVTDHTATNLGFIEDLSHEGPALAMSTGMIPEGEFLRVHLAQWPYSRQPEPFLAMEVGPDSDCAELPASAALAFADQLVAHADTIRRMAGVLGGAA